MTVSINQGLHLGSPYHKDHSGFGSVLGNDIEAASPQVLEIPDLVTGVSFVALGQDGTSRDILALGPRI